MQRAVQHLNRDHADPLRNARRSELRMAAGTATVCLGDAGLFVYSVVLFAEGGPSTAAIAVGALSLAEAPLSAFLAKSYRRTTKTARQRRRIEGIKNAIIDATIDIVRQAPSDSTQLRAEAFSNAAQIAAENGVPSLASQFLTCASHEYIMHSSSQQSGYIKSITEYVALAFMQGAQQISSLPAESALNTIQRLRGMVVILLGKSFQDARADADLAFEQLLPASLLKPEARLRRSE